MTEDSPIGYFLRRCERVVISACWLTVLVCCFSGRTEAQVPSARPLRADTQLWPEVQVTAPLRNNLDITAIGQLRMSRNAKDIVDKRAGAGLSLNLGSRLTLSPSYLRIVTQPAPGRSAAENRLNLAATIRMPPLWHFTITNRALFERRLREPLNSTRYRHRVQVDYPLGSNGRTVKIFIADEVFYDWSNHGWVRNRFAVGFSRRFSRHYTGDFYYMRQNDGRTRPGDIHIVGVVLRLRV